MARTVQVLVPMKHSLLMVLGAGIVALDYLVYRVSGANQNIRISHREHPSC